MPLSDNMQLCLQHINGPEGIVSSIGVVPHVRGDRRDYDNVTICHALNDITKVLFKGPEPTVYVSIIHNHVTSEMIVSYPGKPHRYDQKIGRALTQENVDRLLDILRIVVQNPTLEAKSVLFKAMYESGNDLLMVQLENLRKTELLKHKKHHPNNFQLVQEILDVFDISDDNHQGIAVNVIDQILPDIVALTPLLARPVRVMSYTSGHEHKYYGVHVEVKGIHFATTESADQVQFNIGLAHRDSKLPGCCAGCSAEFDVMTQSRQYVINRTADFSSNFPSKNYQTSQNVTSDPDIFREFVRILHAKCDYMVQAPEYKSLADHPFFDQAVAVLGEGE